jgi:hypothetical protein
MMLRKKRDKALDNINQVILFIKHLMAKSGHKSMDVFQLCSQLRQNGLLVSVAREPKLPVSVPSLWFKQQEQYVILYRAFPRFVFTQLHILHELSHILLRHSPFTK